MEYYALFDVRQLHGIHCQRFSSSLVAIPLYGKVNEPAHIYRNLYRTQYRTPTRCLACDTHHPVIVEVLVHDLSHGRLVLVQCFR